MKRRRSRIKRDPPERGSLLSLAKMAGSLAPARQSHHTNCGENERAMKLAETGILGCYSRGPSLWCLPRPWRIGFTDQPAENATPAPGRLMQARRTSRRRRKYRFATPAESIGSRQEGADFSERVTASVVKTLRYVWRSRGRHPIRAHRGPCLDAHPRQPPAGDMPGRAAS